MAFITDTAPRRTARGSVLTRFLGFLVRVAEGNDRYTEMTRLQRKSDAELAEMGLAREDIPHRVLSAAYYI